MMLCLIKHRGASPVSDVLADIQKHFGRENFCSWNFINVDEGSYMTLIRRIHVRHQQNAMSKPAPPGWNKTIEDLFEEIKQGKRLFSTGDELEWARDYERSLLPSGIVFPRGKQIWESLHECDVLVHYIFAAPASDCGTGRLAAGERVRISEGTTDPKPIAVSFLPLRYGELQGGLVPADVLREPLYTNYALSVKTAYFNAHFRLVEDAD
ncbi:MAG: hypothetical protein AB1757_07415 [Acidobacteriota bacterium]